MGILSITCKWILPTLLLSIAIVIGWFASHELPLGLFFATMIPLMQYKLPPPVVGHGRMVGTPPVPDDLQPAPRPPQELFLTLPDGSHMPQTGLGMCCRASAYDDTLVYRTVVWYLLLGGRHIDTAHLYLNHRAIGKGIQAAVARGVPRSEIFVTTKVFPYHFGYEATKAIVPTFLEELGLEYVDLVLMHFPAPFPYIMNNDCQRRKISPTACRQETFRALTDLRATGIVRNVGVSNFAVQHLQELENKQDFAPIANNQIQYSPFTDASVQDTFAYCEQHNITITAYSPLGGLLDQDKAFAYGVLQTLSTKYERPVSQIMLRWAMQCGAAVIPGTGNPKHMRENLDIYNFVLTADDMATIDGLKHHDIAKTLFNGMDVRTVD